MPQSGRDEPTEPVGPAPRHTGLVEPQLAADQPPPNGPVPPVQLPGPPGGEPAYGQLGPDHPAGGPDAPGYPPAGPGAPGYGLGGQQFLPPPGPGGPDGVALLPVSWRSLRAQLRPRSVWRPTRREARAALVLVVLFAVVGAGVAVAWLQLAPRLGFRVVAPNSPEPVAAEQEQFFATDGWFTMLTLLVGMLGAVLAWRVRGLRGPVGMVAVCAGGLVGAVVTWRLGLLIAPAPTSEQLQQVGRIVYPALRLRATAALMVEPLAAVGGYLLLVGFSSRNDLGRADGGPQPVAPPPGPW